MITPRITARTPLTRAGQYSGVPATFDYAAPVQRPVDNSGWRIGQNVEHAKFGEGVVLNVEGNGADARVQVKFRKAGSKWLSLEYAKLTAV